MKELIHLKNEKVVMFDCDDTLVMWANDNSYKPDDEGVLAFNTEPEIELDPKWVYLKSHGKHIAELIRYHEFETSKEEILRHYKFIGTI